MAKVSLQVNMRFGKNTMSGYGSVIPTDSADARSGVEPHLIYVTAPNLPCLIRKAIKRAVYPVKIQDFTLTFQPGWPE